MSNTTEKKVVKKTTTPKKAENTITLTNDQLQEIIKTSVAAALGAVPAPQPQVVPQEKNTGNVVSAMSKQFADERRAMDRFISGIASGSDEDLVPIMIPRMYKPYLPTVKAGINGAVIFLKPDGVVRYIHKDIYPLIKAKLEHIDKLVAAMEDSSEYANIMEYRR